MRLAPRRLLFALLVLAEMAFIAWALWPSANQHQPNTTATTRSTDALTTLRLGLQDGPRTLDSTRAVDATSQRLLGLVSFGLVRAESFTPQPGAMTLLQADNHQHFTFQLNPLTRHDGAPLTVDHIIDFYRRLGDPTQPTPLKALADKIKQIERVDNQTLRFSLHAPAPWLWVPNSLFSLPLTWPATTGETAQRRLERIGLGPYQVTEFTPRRTVLTASATAPATAPRQVVFTVVPDPAVRLLKLRNDELDIVQDDLPLELFTHAAKTQAGQLTALTHRPGSSYTYLGFLHTHPILRDVRVRLALAHATDLPALRTYLLQGLADPAQSLLMPDHPAYWPAPDYGFNPAQAAALLEAAGYPANPQTGQRLQLELTISSNPLIFRVAQALQQQWAQVGVVLELRTLEWASFFTSVQQGQAPLYIMNWVGRYHPDIYAQVFHQRAQPPAGLNRGRVANATLNSWLDELATTSGPAALLRAHQVQQYQHQQVLYLPLWRLPRLALVSNRLTGYQVNADGDYRGVLTTRAQTTAPAPAQAGAQPAGQLGAATPQ